MVPPLKTCCSAATLCIRVYRKITHRNNQPPTHFKVNGTGESVINFQVYTFASICDAFPTSQLTQSPGYKQKLINLESLLVHNRCSSPHWAVACQATMQELHTPFSGFPGNMPISALFGIPIHFVMRHKVNAELSVATAFRPALVHVVE